MGAVPLLYWYGLDGARKGILHVRGTLTHREIVREEDALDFRCQEQPDKYDRVLWWDEDDGAWREHYVRDMAAC